MVAVMVPLMTRHPMIDFPPFPFITLIFVASTLISPLLNPTWRPPLQISSYSLKPSCQVSLPLTLSKSPTITFTLVSALKVVCAYYNINTPIARLMDLESPHFDVLWLKIYLPTTTIFLCFCYCSPNATKLILDSQHSFRSGRSCLINLVDFFHDMFSIYDKSRAVDILYLDFRKAFDKVPHKRLMAKVRSLGIVDEVGDWIEDWLSDRKQRVVINGTLSGWRDVTSGVPQGSVLGPLLFIIYINDLDLGLVSKISKFADDTKMGINAVSDAAVKQLQEDLRKVGEWSKKWQMPFNLDKCKIMHIGHKNKNEKYELLGKEIESVQQEKDLGVVITNDLKSSNQCIEAVKKAQKLLGYIKRQFRTRNKETILTLYNALVRPHLEYAVQFWSPSLRKDIERLEAVQARATKLIPSIRHLGYVRRLERLNLYSLEKRRLRGQLIETFKMLKGVNNIDYKHLFTFSNNRTRSNGWKLELKRFNTSQCGNFFTYKIAPIWNRLPAEAVNNASVEQFKIELDKVIDTLI